MNPGHEIHVRDLHTYPLCRTCGLTRVTDPARPCDCCTADARRREQKKTDFMRYLNDQQQQDTEQHGLF